MRWIFSTAAVFVYLSLIPVVISQETFSNDIPHLGLNNVVTQKPNTVGQNPVTIQGTKNVAFQGGGNPGEKAPETIMGSMKASPGTETNPEKVTRAIQGGSNHGEQNPETIEGSKNIATTSQRTEVEPKPNLEEQDPEINKGLVDDGGSDQESAGNSTYLSVVGILAVVGICVAAVLVHRRRQYKPSGAYLDLEIRSFTLSTCKVR